MANPRHCKVVYVCEPKELQKVVRDNWKVHVFPPFGLALALIGETAGDIHEPQMFPKTTQRRACATGRCFICKARQLDSDAAIVRDLTYMTAMV